MYLQNHPAVQKAYTVSRCSVHSYLSVDILSNVLNFISKDVLRRMKVAWWTVTAKYEAISFFPDRPNPLTAWCFLYNCASGILQVWIMYSSINNLFSTHQDVISKRLHLLYWYCTKWNWTTIWVQEGCIDMLITMMLTLMFLT